MVYRSALFSRANEILAAADPELCLVAPHTLALATRLQEVVPLSGVQWSGIVAPFCPLAISEFEPPLSPRLENKIDAVNILKMMVTPAGWRFLLNRREEIAGILWTGQTHPDYHREYRKDYPVV